MTAQQHQVHKATGEYLRSIGITGARWKLVHKYHFSTEMVDLVFRNEGAEKQKFIFELHGGCSKLNAFIRKALLKGIRDEHA